MAFTLPGASSNELQLIQSKIRLTADEGQLWELTVDDLPEDRPPEASRQEADEAWLEEFETSYSIGAVDPRTQRTASPLPKKMPRQSDLNSRAEDFLGQFYFAQPIAGGDRSSSAMRSTTSEATSTAAATSSSAASRSLDSESEMADETSIQINQSLLERLRRTDYEFHSSVAAAAQMDDDEFIDKILGEHVAFLVAEARTEATAAAAPENEAEEDPAAPIAPPPRRQKAKTRECWNGGSARPGEFPPLRPVAKLAHLTGVITSNKEIRKRLLRPKRAPKPLGKLEPEKGRFFKKHAEEQGREEYNRAEVEEICRHLYEDWKKKKEKFENANRIAYEKERDKRRVVKPRKERDEALIALYDRRELIKTKKELTIKKVNSKNKDVPKEVKPMSRTEEGEFVDRMTEGYNKRKKAKMDRLNHKYLAKKKESRKLTPAEMQELVHKVYTEPIANSNANSQMLADKYLARPHSPQIPRLHLPQAPKPVVP